MNINELRIGLRKSWTQQTWFLLVHAQLFAELLLMRRKEMPLCDFIGFLVAVANKHGILGPLDC